LLCYRCGSHVPDSGESCGSCGQKLTAGGVRQATATFSRKKLQGSIDGAPYKADDLVAGRYLIKDAVGAGPLGHVFRAFDKQASQEVALKVINPRLVQTAEERKAFGQAVRQWRKVSHNNLARLYDEGEESDRPFYVVQFLEGMSLRRIIDLRLSKAHFFEPAELEPILAQIVAALEAVHRLGAHSDLKPDNVMVLPDLLKVTDVGLGLGMPRLPFVQAMKPRKADRYLAPEFVDGGQIDQRADIYSLGVMIGEMLAGVTPDGSIPELLALNPTLPPQLEGLYRKTLNSNPLARPKTVQELQEEFIEATRKIQAPPPLKAKPLSESTVIGGGTVGVGEPVTSDDPAQTLRLRPPGSGSLRRSNLLEEALPPVPESELVPPLTGAALAAAQDRALETELKGLPLDLTQPMDPALIPGLINESLPPPVFDQPTREESAQSETVAVPPLSGYEVTDAAIQALPPPAKSRAAVWLVVLSVSGLAMGSAGGYLMLQQLRSPPPPKPVVKSSAPFGSVLEAPPNPKPGPPQQPTPVTGLIGGSADAGTLLAAAPPAVVGRVGTDTSPRPDNTTTRTAEPKKKTVVASIEPAAAPAAAARGESCPDGMRKVGGGAFRMGTPADDPMRGFDERSLASTEVQPFCIDTFEYPNRKGSMPTVGVSWHDAKRLCENRSKRLCTEEEWEKACKGPGNARFPYGSSFDPNACNTEDDSGEDRPLVSSGTFAKCRSGYGVADLSGNVAEWTASPYAGSSDRAQKGGAFDRPDYAARCSARKNGAPGSRADEVGFRCCTDLDG
jgi:serine/threonine protein kinase